MKNKISRFVRKELLDFKPYKSARDEFVNDGRDMILLDANENPFKSDHNRYPDPMQIELKNRIADWKKVNIDQLYLSNGSDEFISQIIMSCCEPSKEHIIILPPTFGMYKVSASIHGVQVKEVPLDSKFQLDVKTILETASKQSKIIFIPTPNNPTANSFNTNAIKDIIEGFSGLVVVDEAYIEFNNQPSFINLLDDYFNLVVCQTFSKAQGMAGARLGMAFANRDLISFLNSLKAPYNLNSLTINTAIQRLDQQDLVKKQVRFILKERQRLEIAFSEISFIKTIFPSDANFLLIRADNSSLRYNQLLAQGIVVRNSSKNISCGNTLRISVGIQEENNSLISALRNIDI